MQNKKTRKIIIDQYKLDILFRLGCPDSVIIGLLKTGKFTKTGDRLLDETLESLLTIKEFSNWGGNHNPTGKNQHSGQLGGQLGGQLDLQDGGQLGGQDVGQDADKDKERDIKKHTTLSGDLVLSPITNNSFKEKEKEKESAGVGKTNNPDVLIGNLATAFDSRKTIVNKTPINPNLKKFIATFSKDTQKRFYSWLDKSKSGKQLEPVSMLKALATIIRKPEQEIKDLYFSSINV